MFHKKVKKVNATELCFKRASMRTAVVTVQFPIQTFMQTDLISEKLSQKQRCCYPWGKFYPA